MNLCLRPTNSKAVQDFRLIDDYSPARWGTGGKESLGRSKVQVLCTTGYGAGIEVAPTKPVALLQHGNVFFKQNEAQHQQPLL
jgi:hypothetical protein